MIATGWWIVKKTIIKLKFVLLSVPLTAKGDMGAYIGIPILIVSPVRSTYGGYYGLVIVPPPRPRPQTLHRSHDNLKNPYWIASIFYM